MWHTYGVEHDARVDGVVDAQWYRGGGTAPAFDDWALVVPPVTRARLVEGVVYGQPYGRMISAEDGDGVVEMPQPVEVGHIGSPGGSGAGDYLRRPWRHVVSEDLPVGLPVHEVARSADWNPRTGDEEV